MMLVWVVRNLDPIYFVYWSWVAGAFQWCFNPAAVIPMPLKCKIRLCYSPDQGIYTKILYGIHFSSLYIVYVSYILTIPYLFHVKFNNRLVPNAFDVEPHPHMLDSVLLVDGMADVRASPTCCLLAVALDRSTQSVLHPGILEIITLPLITKISSSYG